MAADAEEICNLALGWVGGEQVTDITTDTSDEAVLCNANFAPLRKAVLMEREWTFAVSRINLDTPSVTVPVYGFDNAFDIPTSSPEVLRVLQVSRADTDVVSGGPTERSGIGIGRHTAVEWLREGSQIMVNGAADIYCRVIIDITDTTKFSPVFDQALAARLAMEFAIPLTGSRMLQRDMAALYGEKLSIAAGVEGSQGRSYRTRSNSLTIVR